MGEEETITEVGEAVANHRAAMATNGRNQASPTKDAILEIIRLPRTHSNMIPAPMAISNDQFTWVPVPKFRTSVYRKVGVILSIYLGAGTLCFYLVRHQISGKKTNSILDALYLTFVSMTCVGYGDLSPEGTLAILLVSLFSFLGILLIGLVLSKAADVLMEKQEQLLEKTVGTAATLQAEQMESNKMRNKGIMLVVLLVVLMVVGTAVLVSVEDLDLIHAFYCINATLTSVGSKKCFSTKGGRVFALFWMLIGTIYVGQMLFTFTELHTQRRWRSLRDWVLKKKITISDMLEADIDHDGVLKISEYVLHKLKEMRKISKEDIAPIFNDFHRLDFNNMGVLKGSAHPAAMVSNGALPREPHDQIPLSDLQSMIAAHTQMFKIYFSMKQVLIIYYIYLGAGTLCFYLIRHQISGTKTNGFIDALYFTIVLTTSVGYGDLTPDTTLAILLAALCSFMGKVLIGILLTGCADLFVEQKEIINNIDTVDPRKVGIQKPIKMRSMNKLRKPVLLFVFHIAVGTAILVPVEDLDFIHAFYCINATITSVGSDKCFSTKGGRIFALFWIMSAITISALVLFTFTELQTERRRSSLLKEALKQKATPADLEAADLDDDGVVVSAEYILHKLEEMGKINREDMAPIIEEFRRLDVNNKGELTRHDIM